MKTPNNDIRPILSRLEALWQKTDAPVLRYLQPGLKPETIREMFEDQGVPYHPDLITLYSWKNGVDIRYPTGYTGFSLGGCFIPLEEAIYAYKEHTKEEYYSNMFFPFFASDYLLIVTDPKKNEYGEIFYYSPALAILEPIKKYESMSSFLLLTYLCFKRGYYYYDERELFTVKDDKKSDLHYQRLGKRINPNSAWWEDEEP